MFTCIYIYAEREREREKEDWWENVVIAQIAFCRDILGNGLREHTA
jgi:hypothetical protein